MNNCIYTCDECHTSLSLQVNYIFEIEDSIPFIRKFSFINTSTTPIKLDDVIQKEFQDRDSAVIDEIKVYTFRCTNLKTCQSTLGLLYYRDTFFAYSLDD